MLQLSGGTLVPKTPLAWPAKWLLHLVPWVKFFLKLLCFYHLNGTLIRKTPPPLCVNPSRSCRHTCQRGWGRFKMRWEWLVVGSKSRNGLWCSDPVTLQIRIWKYSSTHSVWPVSSRRLSWLISLLCPLLAENWTCRRDPLLVSCLNPVVLSPCYLRVVARFPWTPRNYFVARIPLSIPILPLSQYMFAQHFICAIGLFVFHFFFFALRGKSDNRFVFLFILVFIMYSLLISSA